jgi:hypothetical protein
LHQHRLRPPSVGAALGRRDIALGATLVMRASTLERIGGFAAVADYLADDHRIELIAEGRAHLPRPRRGERSNPPRSGRRFATRSVGADGPRVRRSATARRS